MIIQESSWQLSYFIIHQIFSYKRVIHTISSSCLPFSSEDLLCRTIFQATLPPSSGVLLNPISKDNHSWACGLFSSLIGGRKQRPVNPPWVFRHPSQPVVYNFSLVMCGLGGGDRGCRWERMRGQGSIYEALGTPPALLCGYFKVICAPAYNHLPVTL